MDIAFFRNSCRAVLITMALALGMLSVGQPVELYVDSASVLRNSQGVPAKFLGRTICTFYAGFGPMSTAARAKVLESRVASLAGNPFFNPDSLYILHYESSVGVFYYRELISVVTNADSIAEHKPRYDIARQRVNGILEVIEQYNLLHSKDTIWMSILYAVLLLVLFFIVIGLLQRGYRIVRTRVSNWQGTKRTLVKFINSEFLTRERQVAIVLFLIRVLRIFIFLMIVVLFLGLMFYLLPWTKYYTLHFTEILLQPFSSFLDGLIDFIPDLLTICVILFISYWINRLFKFLKEEIEKGDLRIPGFYPEWALPTYNIIRVVIWLFTIIVIWPYIPGSDSKIFQGISVFLGLIFSLTSASLFSNIMAGFSLTYTRAFHLGDRVKVGDAVGDVVEKTMLVTKLRTIKNEVITIPNSKIMSSEVINYSEEASGVGLILHTTITIGYDAPWRQIHKLLYEAALATEGIVDSPPPFILQTALNDFYVSYQINVYTREANKMAVLYSDLHRNIQDKFNEAGVEIMSPHYGALRDGNTIAIPDQYRPAGYEPPSFRTGAKR